MQRILTTETISKVGEEVLLKGSIATRRNMGKLAFIDLRDRRGQIQVVMVPAELDEASQVLLPTLRPEYVIAVTGIVQARGAKQINPNVPTGTVEILAKKVEILAEADSLPYDLQDATLNTDTLLNNLPLNLRREDEKAIFRIQATIVRGFREYLRSQEFTEFQCPKLVGSAMEGGANFFKMPYFNYVAVLAQSPQFYKQIMVGPYERVFTVGNVYRAEAHDTNRHLSEYTSMDFEMGYIESWVDVMHTVEGVIRNVADTLAKDCAADMALLKAEPMLVPEGTFPVMKLREVQAILEKEYGEKCLTEPDLEPHQERQIGEYVKKNFNSDFLFITHYPVSKRPMYTWEDQADPGFTGSFDLVFRGMELCTGGQRIHQYEKLKNNIIKWGLNPEDFKFYLSAFQYGMPPHGGIGMGLERFTANLVGLNNVKLATLFPRDQVRIDLPLVEIQGKRENT